MQGDPSGRFKPPVVQYKSLSTLSDNARNRLKGGFYDGPDLTTVNFIGYNAKNRLECGVKSVITRI